MLSYEVADLEGSSKEVNLLDFGMDKDGVWHFTATAVRTGYELVDDVFLSGYGYIWLDDVAFEQHYYLTINIDGWDSFFETPDFYDWYTFNTTRYDTPTQLFVSIAGFFTPIFNMIGNFGDTIVKYFNINTSYDLGFGVGKFLNFFGYILIGLAVFLGGFGFVQWFLIIIGLMIGIFVLRFALKFIPGFNN